VVVTRVGGPANIQLALAAARTQADQPETRLWKELGVRVEAMATVEVQKLQSRYRGGLLVTAVRPDGPAADEGIRAGDMLVGLHVWETISPDNVVYVLDRAQQEQLGPLKFYVLRGGETLFGHLTWDTVRR
jgi:serine protease Do